MRSFEQIRQSLEDHAFIPRGWRNKPESWQTKREHVLRVLELFKNRFPTPKDKSVFIGFVPGRVEVLGKHTDYAGGHSLLFTLDRGFVFAAALNDTHIVRMHEDSREFEPIEFELSTSLKPVTGEWGNYPMTAVRRLMANFENHHRLAGVDIAFRSDLPIGSGMSGSSALMIMTFIAVAEANGLTRCEHFRNNIRNGIDLAMYLACVENGQSFRELTGGRGVGTFGGSEDHTAILNGKTETLSLFQFCPTVAKGDFFWPQDWQLIICFSGARAEKTGPALEHYNRLSKQAELTVELFNRETQGSVRTLRETLDSMQAGRSSNFGEFFKERAQKIDQEWDISGRMVQFYLEDRLFIPGAVQALLWNMPTRFGRFINRSHDASQRYLDNIAPEIQFLQSSAIALGAYGASGFGGGFGGSLYAVVQQERAKEFMRKWEASYREYERSDLRSRSSQSAFFLSSPSDGVQDWSRHDPGRWIDGMS